MCLQLSFFRADSVSSDQCSMLKPLGQLDLLRSSDVVPPCMRTGFSGRTKLSVETTSEIWVCL